MDAIDGTHVLVRVLEKGIGQLSSGGNILLHKMYLQMWILIIDSPKFSLVGRVLLMMLGY